MRPTVLIVDDNRAVTEILRALLSRNNYHVEVANSPEVVFDLLADTPVDVIVSDVMMPGMDGFTLGRKIRQDPATADIPIVYLTALTDIEDEFESYLSGGDAFVSKPFRAVDLLKTIEKVLKRETEAASASSSGRLAVVKQEVARLLACLAAPDARRAVQAAADMAGFELEIATTFDEALKRLDREKFHLLVCDIRGRRDRVEAVQEFMRHFALATPVVFLHDDAGRPKLEEGERRYAAHRMPTTPSALEDAFRHLVADFGGLL